MTRSVIECVLSLMGAFCRFSALFMAAREGRDIWIANSDCTIYRVAHSLYNLTSFGFTGYKLMAMLMFGGQKYFVCSVMAVLGHLGDFHLEHIQWVVDLVPNFFTEFEAINNK